MRRSVCTTSVVYVIRLELRGGAQQLGLSDVVMVLAKSRVLKGLREQASDFSV